MVDSNLELVYVPLTDNHIFKRIFCDENKTKYFKSFYESMFGEKVEEIQILENTKFHKQAKGKKIVELDALAKINGEYVHLEMQRQGHKGMWKRIEVYSSKLLMQIVEGGTKYKDVKKIRSIWIFEGKLNNKCKKYINKVKKVIENCMNIEDEVFEITIVELGKIGKELKEEEIKDPIKVWFYVMKTKEVEKLEAARNMYPIIDELIEEECMEAKAMALAWAKAREEQEVINYQIVASEYAKEGREKGMKEGLKKGRKEGCYDKQVQVILEMHKANCAIEFISNIVKLPKEEVIKVIEKTNNK